MNTCNHLYSLESASVLLLQDVTTFSVLPLQEESPIPPLSAISSHLDHMSSYVETIHSLFITVHLLYNESKYKS